MADIFEQNQYLDQDPNRESKEWDDEIKNINKKKMHPEIGFRDAFFVLLLHGIYQHIDSILSMLRTGLAVSIQRRMKGRLFCLRRSKFLILLRKHDS